MGSIGQISRNLYVPGCLSILKNLVYWRAGPKGTWNYNSRPLKLLSLLLDPFKHICCCFIDTSKTSDNMLSRNLLRGRIVSTTPAQLLTPFKSTANITISTIRYQSTTTSSTPNLNANANANTDAIADEEAQAWLSTVRELRAQYETTGIPDYESAQMKQLKTAKFEPTEAQLEQYAQLKDKPIPMKEDKVVSHCINMIMKDGKKSKAQKYMARALYIVRLKLREDPVEALKQTLDKLGPLMETKTYKTRVAKNLVVPVPLTERQRFRRAFLWILEGSDKRRSKDFSVRLGEEIIDAYNGKSSGYDKRLQLHKQAILHRAYVKLR